MNIVEKLVEQFERVICVREHLRHHWKANPAKDEADAQSRLNSLVQINEVVAMCRAALGGDDAIKTLAALEETKRIP